MDKLKPILKIIAIIAIVAVGSFAVFKLLQPELDHQATGDNAMEAPEIRDLKVVAIKSQVLNRVDQIPGEIYAYQDVAIYPKVPGFIEWISVDRGSIVKKGQLMIGLIAPEMIARRNEASAKVASTKSDLHASEATLAETKSLLAEAKAKLAGDTDTYERTRKAAETPGVVAPNTVVVLENQVKADQEKVNAIAEQITAVQNRVESMAENVRAAQRSFDNYKDLEDYLKIAAPFDGYITERNMHVGSFVGPLGEKAYPPIVRIQQLNNLRIVAPVPEIDTAGVEPGKPVEFSVSTHPGRRFTGTVKRIGNYLVQRTRTMPVELNFWNHNYDVLPGMFCEIYWPTKRQYPTLFVPVSSVVTQSTIEDFVCKIGDDKKVSWVKVRKGQMMGDLIEVFADDIQAGDMVAVQGTDELTPGLEVKPIVVEEGAEELKPKKRPAYPAHHGS